MPPKPFKPPRPSASVKKPTKRKVSSASVRKSTSSTTKSTSRASGSSAFSLPALDASDSEPDPFASQDKGLQRTQEAPEEEEEEETTILPDEDERRERIPPELLTRLLHEFFTHESTRLSKEASPAVGRYMETFVREAVTRAAFMRAEIQAQNGGGGGGDGFLEVSYEVVYCYLTYLGC
jgi:hypothetical protein